MYLFGSIRSVIGDVFLGKKEETRVIDIRVVYQPRSSTSLVLTFTLILSSFFSTFSTTAIVIISETYVVELNRKAIHVGFSRLVMLKE